MSEAKKAAQAAAAPAARASTGTVVWCGPSVRGVARQYDVFRGGVPEKMQQFAEQYPAAKALLVPIENFAAVRGRIDAGTGAESILIHSIRKQMKED